MTEKFYDVLTDDVRHCDRWFLLGSRDAAGNEIDSYEFRCSRRYIGPSPVLISIGQEGRSVKFNFADIDLPVVSEEVATTIENLASQDVQLLPVTVSGQSEKYFILNTLWDIPCLDTASSIIEWWTDKDNRPDKVGKPRMVVKLRIIPEKAQGHHVFRVKDWGVLIVSETLKYALEKIQDTGIRFECVSEETASGPKIDYRKFYEELFAPLGPFDSDTLFGVFGFDSGGPLGFRTIGAGKRGRYVTYVSCELAVRQDQLPGELGRYELLCTSDNEDWVQAVITQVGRLSLDECFGDGDTLDIGAWVAPEDAIQGILFEKVHQVVIDGQPYGILRCIGITRSEMEYVQSLGHAGLLAKLKEANIYPYTTSNRESVC